MSADPQMMAQLLMQRGQQPGMAGSPPAQNGMNLLQQVLAMQQLKQRLGQLPQQPPQPGQPPGTLMPPPAVGSSPNG
jgi:hypothetical protein